MKIALYGYYGKGNWGDDLLMCVSYRLLQARFPEAQIAIAADEQAQAWISSLLGHHVALVPAGDRSRYDMIVHGGGGVFFDYTPARFQHRLVGCLFRKLGYKRYVWLIRKLRTLIGKPFVSAPKRVALGVGVGSYTSGSPKFRQHLLTMEEMSALWLRDRASEQHLVPFSSVLDAPVIAGSDLVFLSQYWLPELPPKPIAKGKPRVGLILRDFPATCDLPSLIAYATSLREHYEVSIFLLDAKADASYANGFDGFAMHIWQPETMSLAAFTAALAAQDVVITSRAHGAIGAACLGIASVIIDIEPKLRTIHQMLPHSSVLVGPNPGDEWHQAIKQALAIAPDAVAADAAKNCQQSEQALAKIWSVVDDET